MAIISPKKRHKKFFRFGPSFPPIKIFGYASVLKTKQPLKLLLKLKNARSKIQNYFKILFCNGYT